MKKAILLLVKTFQNNTSFLNLESLNKPDYYVGIKFPFDAWKLRNGRPLHDLKHVIL